MMNEDVKRIMVVDIDGTLAEVGPRRQLLEVHPVDWDAFYRDSFDDEPIPEICHMVCELAKSYEVVFCTSRRESVRQATQLWLKRHLGMEPSAYTLIMRRNSDFRPEVVSKINTFHQETTPEERRSVAFVLEDNPAVANGWRLSGYRCLHVI